MPKPLLFVGSSVESLEIAYAVQENLDPHTARVKVWPQGVFTISDFGLDSLLQMLSTCDFGAFIFAPDDLVTIRKQRHRAVRDNVLFELGLFMGRLGRERTFVIVPNRVEIHLPSDLVGLNLATYEPDRDDHVAALGVACNKIRQAVRTLGFHRPARVSKETVFSIAEPIERKPGFRAIPVQGIRRVEVGPAKNSSKRLKSKGKKKIGRSGKNRRRR